MNTQLLYTYFEKILFLLIYSTSSRDLELVYSCSTSSAFCLFPLGHLTGGFWVWKVSAPGRDISFLIGVLTSLASLFSNSCFCVSWSSRSAFQSEHCGTSSESSWSWHPGNSLGHFLFQRCKLHNSLDQE